MRHARFLVLLVVCGFARPALPGHGFMNSFADVEWLPPPGLTPRDTLYVFDTLGERVMLALARFRGDPLAQSFRYGKEKLAEASAMIKLRDDTAADRALAHHIDYLAYADAVVRATATPDAPAPRYAFINNVLEHVYILSVDYMDMPLGVRADVLEAWFDRSMAYFAAHREVLSAPDREALFFKEEEIRWSLEMVTQADVQNITNE